MPSSNPPTFASSKQTKTNINMKKITLSIYHSKEYGRLRIAETDCLTCYNVRDVCRILDFNSQLATKMVREKHDYNVVTFEFGDGQKMNFFTPDGLLELYFKKKKQDGAFARRFHEWCLEIKCNENGVEYTPFFND